MDTGAGFNSRIRQWLQTSDTVPSSPSANGGLHRPVSSAYRSDVVVTATTTPSSKVAKTRIQRAEKEEDGIVVMAGSTTLPATMPNVATINSIIRGARIVGSGGTGVSFHSDMIKHRRAPDPYSLEEAKTVTHLAMLNRSSGGSVGGSGNGPQKDFGGDQSFGVPECERPERVERTWSHLVACGLPQLCKYQCGPPEAFQMLPTTTDEQLNIPTATTTTSDGCCCCCGGCSAAANVGVLMCSKPPPSSSLVNTNNTATKYEGVYGRRDVISEPLVPAKNKTLRLVHDRDHIDAVDGYSDSLVMSRMFQQGVGEEGRCGGKDTQGSHPTVNPIPRPFSIDGGNDLYYNDATSRSARLAAQGVVQLALEVCKWDESEVAWFEANRPDTIRAVRDSLASSSTPSVLPQRTIQNGLAVVRPPGHHCSGTSPSGFCFYNNVAVAARAAQKAFPERIKRVLVVDWDVHHGNGTEEIFYDDPSVLFFSVHQHGSKAGHTVRMSRLSKRRLQQEESRRRKWQEALRVAQEESNRRQEEMQRVAREKAAADAAISALATTTTTTNPATITSTNTAADVSVKKEEQVVGTKRARGGEISAEELLAAFFAGGAEPVAVEPVVKPEAGPTTTDSPPPKVVAEAEPLPPTALVAEEQQLEAPAEEINGRRGGRPRRRIDVVALEAQLDTSDLNNLLASAGVAPTTSTEKQLTAAAPINSNGSEDDNANGDDDGDEDDDDDCSDTTTSSAGSRLSWMKSLDHKWQGDDCSSYSDADFSESSSEDVNRGSVPIPANRNTCQAALGRKLRRVRRKLLEAQGRTVRSGLRRRRRIAKGCATTADLEEIGTASRKRGFKVGTRSQFRQEKLAFKGDETPDGSSFSDRVDVWTDGEYSLSERTWESGCEAHDDDDDMMLSSAAAPNNMCGKGKVPPTPIATTNTAATKNGWRFAARSRLSRRKQAPFYPASGFLDRIGGTDMLSGRRFNEEEVNENNNDSDGSDNSDSTNFSDLSEGSLMRRAAGTTINAPWPTHSMGDLEYLYLLEAVLLPLVRHAGGGGSKPAFFRPDLVLVSSGFDSCAEDILGSQALSPSGYYWMTHMLASIFATPTTSTTSSTSSKRPRPQRVVVALEGGYNLKNVALSSEMVLRALIESSDDSKCLEELERRREAAERSVLRELKQEEAQRRQVRMETRRLKRLAKEARACLKAGNPVPEAALGTAAAGGVSSAIGSDQVFKDIQLEFAQRKRLDWDRAVASRQRDHTAEFCGGCACCRQSLLAAKDRSLLGQCRKLATKIHAAHKPYWNPQ